MTEILLLVAAIFGIWIFKNSKTKQYPNRLLELEQALQTHAALRLHRNEDAQTSQNLELLAKDLQRAQYLVNDGNDSVRSNWSRLRPQILHLTSEDTLKSVDLFYTDRREEFKAAVYDLVSRLDKMEGQTSRQRNGSP